MAWLLHRQHVTTLRDDGADEVPTAMIRRLPHRGQHGAPLSLTLLLLGHLPVFHGGERVAERR
eukprot:CAMPEP_0170414064 /NCGR_PEP_ID=MMETSP0117_2-20130122/31866_1 /TAXON_ID=400756 /ORGANISM="Durinskia baltica, Strain CSIRO CS-38" /LENGTH=62 /DNA_ID=CAMNT_0010671923 /DNA_START=384 /DNA_END=568 /DNA_ORIENTATION=+